MLKLVLDSYCMFMYASSVFHADDGVYMKDVAGRNEYILCESGRIWAGAHKAFHIWPWEFEQVGHVFKVYHNTSSILLLACCSVQ